MSDIFRKAIIIGKKNSAGKLLIALILIATVLSFSGFKMSVFTPPSNYLKSYIGSGHSQYGDANIIDTGSIAVVKDYKIVMEKTSRFNKPISCKTQSECGGVDSGSKDSDGCPIYDVPVNIPTVMSSGGAGYHYCCCNDGGYSGRCPTGQSLKEIGQTCSSSQLGACTGASYVSMPTTSTKCGGMKTVDTQGCALKAQVYYKNILIDNINWMSSRTIKNYSPYGVVGEGQGDIRIEFAGEYRYYDLSTTCRWIGSFVGIVPHETIEIQVASPKTQYFQGQQVNIDVQVINNGSNTLTGTLDVAYEIPTGLLNPSTQLDTKEITINSGVNTFSYTIPTTESTERIKITPSLKIYLPTTGLSGMSYNDVPISQVTKLPYGSVTEKTFEVMIVPKPLYMTPVNGVCFTGYSINTIGDYCVRDDIKSLTCYQVGCPSVEGHDYQCTSAGQCAETVYTTVWGNCPSGTTATTTDKGENICIKTEIANVFLECSANSAKPAVCSGITATCTNNKWEFTGTCDVITEIQTKEVVREVIVEKPVEVTKTVNVPYVPNWVYVALAGGVVAIFGLLKMKKRR